MNINTITAEDLRRMPDKEGLILQGCGGDLTEWVDGINEMLTNAGILKDGSQFENVFAFQHGELTCLLYPFDDVKLDIGKLALWRLQTHEVYSPYSFLLSSLILVHFCVPCNSYYIVHICVRQVFFINFYTQMCPNVLNYLYTHKAQKGETL